MLLSISCSKDEDPAPLPETPIEPEVVLTDYSENLNDYVATNQVFILKFKPNNLDGFIVPDTIKMMLDGEKITFPDGSFATLSPDRKFTVKGETARQNVTSMLDRMERYIISNVPTGFSFYDINGTWTTHTEDPDTAYFTTLRNDRIWISSFSYKSGKQLGEDFYSAKSFPDKLFPFDMAYGEKSTADLSKIAVYQWTEDFFHLYDSKANSIILWKSGKLCACGSYVLRINPWYEGEYIIQGPNDKVISQVYSKDGDIVVNYVVNAPSFYIGLVYPINHEDYLEIDNNYIYKKSLLLEDSQWWASIPIKYNNSSKYEHSFVCKDENLYTFKVVETTIQGGRKEQQYVLNIDTHEVNLL